MQKRVEKERMFEYNVNIEHSIDLINREQKIEIIYRIVNEMVKWYNILEYKVTHGRILYEPKI